MAWRMSMAADSYELEEGTRLLDRYVVIDRIAGGGMASIYRATDERLERVVCVKLLRLVLEAGSTSGSAVYRATYAHFLQEALALSTLMHPNTLRIYDFGYLAGSGRPFQISEFLDAGQLEQLVRRRGALTSEQVLAILEPIGGALAEAHDRGIIHRDVKPSNILFGRIGGSMVPKLADFGISHSNVKRGPTDDDGEPVSVVALFSPRWAAPEQLAGGTAGAATDVYALALVTIFMLVGRSMFEAKEVRATFPDRMTGDALVTRRLAEMGVPSAAQAVFLRALRAHPSQRTQTVPQFVQELRAALSGPTSLLPPPPRPPSITTETDMPEPRSSSAAHDVRFGSQSARMIEVEERLDLTIPRPLGVDARVRLTFVPSLGGFKLHIKGLNCFVAKDGRPAAAVLADRDGTVDLLSSSREPLGTLRLSFGTVAGGARVFGVNGDQLVVPLTQAPRSVAVLVDTGEVVVMSQRSGAA